MRSVLIIMTCLAGLAFPAAAIAATADTDLEIGSYKGKWCNYDAIFSIESKIEGKWRFHGTLIIPSTGQSDRLFVEQYDDNSLMMIRSLSDGQKQIVYTDAPVIEGANDVVFDGRSSAGPGCKGTRSWFYTNSTDF